MAQPRTGGTKLWTPPSCRIWPHPRPNVRIRGHVGPCARGSPGLKRHIPRGHAPLPVATPLPVAPPTRPALDTGLQFSSVAQAQSCPTLGDPMNRSTPGLPVRLQLPEFTQTHAHRVDDAIQPSHPLSSPFPPALNPSKHQRLFQRVNSSHEAAKVLEFQLQRQSF